MNNYKTLNDWGLLLIHLGFKKEFYQGICGILNCVDWYKGEEHISTEVCYTKEYFDSLKPGVETGNINFFTIQGYL